MLHTVFKSHRQGRKHRDRDRDRRDREKIGSWSCTQWTYFCLVICERRKNSYNFFIPFLTIWIVYLISYCQIICQKAGVVSSPGPWLIRSNYSSLKPNKRVFLEPCKTWLAKCTLLYNYCLQDTRTTRPCLSGRVLAPVLVRTRPYAALKLFIFTTWFKFVRQR